MKNLVILFSILFLAFQANAQLDNGYYVMRQSGKQAASKLSDSKFVVHLATPSQSMGQVWRVERQPDNSYIISQAITGLVMETKCNNCAVNLKSRNGSNAQKWILSSLGSNKFTLVAKGTAYKLTYDPSIQKFKTRNSYSPTHQRIEFKPMNWVVKSPLYTDLRAQQTPYKHQGPRGTCTYFASIAALEAAYKKAGYGELDLSEQAYGIFAKALYLHPKWSDITHANYRENQLGGAQGGGSIINLSHVRIPTEADMAYTNSSSGFDWRSRDQKYMNTANFSQMTDRILQARTYYGVKNFKTIPTTNISARLLESLLRQGTEVKIGVNSGSHVLLLVGFDKTNPSDKKFIVKNSYIETNTPSWEKVEYLSYDQLPNMVHGEYITEVRKPGPWREIAAIGRWKLNFDGWKGQLDIYHIPGTAQYVFNQASNGLVDRRIGVFYDHKGKAHRVNGRITTTATQDIKVEFYFDGKDPNMRYDKLNGRKFIYYLNPKAGLMAGHHSDKSGGTKYGGVATKTSLSARNYSVAPKIVNRLVNTRSKLHLGYLKGTLSFSNTVRYDSSTRQYYVDANFVDQYRQTRYVRVYNYPAEGNALKLVCYNNKTNLRKQESGIIRYLSWNNGILAGSAYYQYMNQPLVLAKL